jgi:hypothetical protein
MPKAPVSLESLKSEILILLASQGVSEITSRDLQMDLPRRIEDRYGHMVMPETVARAWREMREDTDKRCVLCDSVDVQNKSGRPYTKWTIKKVLVSGEWMPWQEML